MIDSSEISLLDFDLIEDDDEHFFDLTLTNTSYPSSSFSSSSSSSSSSSMNKTKIALSMKIMEKTKFLRFKMDQNIIQDTP